MKGGILSLKKVNIHTFIENSAFNFKKFVNLCWSFGACGSWVKNTWFRELAKCKRSSLLFLTGPETVPYILQMFYFSLFALFSFKNSKWHTISSQPLRMLNLRNSMIQDWKQFLSMARANHTGVYAAQLTRWTEGRIQASLIKIKPSD